MSATRGGLVSLLDRRNEAGGVPLLRSFGVAKFARTLGIPGEMAERFDLGGEPFGRRFGAGGEQQPIRCRGVGVRHAVFESPIAEPEGVHERLARIEAGALQPHCFARYTRPVVVEYRSLDPAPCADAARFG